MPRLKTYVFWVAAFFLGASAHAAEAEFKIASFNAAFCRNTADLKNWEMRKAFVMPLVEKNGVDICCMQEPYAFQVRYLQTQTKFYEFVGQLSGFESPKLFADRPDNFSSANIILSNMNNPIWYKRAQFEILENGKFWLSKTPSTPSGGFDQKRFDSERHCVWARFKHLHTGIEFWVFNVHVLCGKSPEDPEQIESAKLLISKIKEISGNGTFLLCGDFNSEENSGTLRTLLASGMREASAISREPLKGEKSTFTGYDDKSSKRLDYIFVSNDVEVYQVEIYDTMKAGLRISDHRPISAVVKIKKQPL